MAKKRLTITPVLLASLAALYLYTASVGAILDDGDALYASVAKEMVLRGDWVTPYANGVRFLDKPPLMYWFMALSFKVFGFTELAARIPTVLAVIGTCLLLYALGRKVAGTLAGAAAALAMGLAPGSFLFTRMVFPDMLFVFMLTLALCGFFAWYIRGGNGVGSALVFYTGTAGAVLSKGLIGLVFPAATVIVFLIFRRRTSWLYRLHPVKGILLLLLLASPWHILAGLRVPGFLWFYFVNEHFLRFLGRRQPVDYQSIPIVLFWALVALWLFPWSAFLGAVPQLVRRSDVQPLFRRELATLCLSWMLVVFVFFSLSSRIEHYSLPIFPPVALAVGLVFSTGTDSNASQARWLRRGFLVLAFIGVILLLAAGAAVWLLTGLFAEHTSAPHTRAYSYYFAPLFDLPREVLAQLRLPLVCTLSGLSLGMLLAWWLNRRGLRCSAVLALSAAMAVFCLSASYSLRACEQILSSKQFAAVLDRSWRPGDRLVVAGDYETANSLNFYTNARIEICGSRAAVLEWGLRYPDAPAMILSEAELRRCWAGPDRVFILAPERGVAALDLGRYYRLQSSAGRVLLSNEVF